MERHLNRTLTLLLALLISSAAWAVQQEDDINQTIKSLYNDLTYTQENLQDELAQLQNAREAYWEHLARLHNQIDKATIELYSQDGGSVFGVGLASDALGDVCEEFRSEKAPFEKWLSGMKIAANRHRSIGASLRRIHRANLSPESIGYLEQSIAICDTLDMQFAAIRDSIALDQQRYDAISAEINRLDTTNGKIVEQLRSEIFDRDREDFFAYFQALDYRSGDLYYDTSRSQKLATELDSSINKISTWNLWTFFISVLIAVLFSVGVRLLAKKHSDFWQKRRYFAFLLFLGCSMISSEIMWLSIDCPGYMVRADDIMGNFYIFLFMLLLSATLRLHRPGLGWAVVAYLPLIFSALAVEELASSMVRTSAVKVFEPLVFTFASLAALIILLIGWKKIPKADYSASYGSILLVLLCTVFSYVGYGYLAIFILMFCISVIVYLSGLACFKFVFRKRLSNADPLVQLTLNAFVYPSYYIITVMASLFNVADSFNLHTWLERYLATPFVNIPQFGIISFSKIVLLIFLAIVVNYMVKLVKAILLRIDETRFQTGGAAVAVTLGTFLAWVCYLLAALFILQINHAGIIAAVGGASLGLGFALKDTFENLFCGIQLMASRARPGDIVECDGARGVIKRIGIMVTEIQVEDGPIVSFPNRLIYGSHFTNLTLNHRREVRHIIFDISDRSNLDKARALMIEAASGVDGVVDLDQHYVVMRHTSSGVVRLDYKCWIDSSKYLRAEPAVREAIFNAFRTNGIEIANFSSEMSLQATSTLLASPK